MKKNNILITFGAVLLTGSLLSSCNGNKNSNEGESNDSVKNEFFSASNDSIASSQESDDTEMQGVFTSEETLNISELPKTAQLQAQKGNYELYVNVEQEANEDDITGVYSVWLADRGKNVVRRILITNPMAAPVWEEMNEKKGGVEVPMDQIAAAERAMFASKDGKRIVVEGCPDARNIWTYIINLDTQTAMQLPGTEGVQDINLDKGEIILASYGYYEEGGRYTYQKAYSLDGKYLRQTSDPEPE